MTVCTKCRSTNLWANGVGPNAGKYTCNNCGDVNYGTEIKQCVCGDQKDNICRESKNCGYK